MIITIFRFCRHTHVLLTGFNFYYISNTKIIAYHIITNNGEIVSSSCAYEYCFFSNEKKQRIHRHLYGVVVGSREFVIEITIGLVLFFRSVGKN